MMFKQLFPLQNRPRLHLALVSAWVVFAPMVSAQTMTAAMPASYRTECGSCHLPYPAALMTKRGWDEILQNTDTHFGENANLETTARRDIEAYLHSHAHTKEHSYGSRTKPQRLSTTHWFRLTHGVAKKSFSDARVGSVANCSACHQYAENGRYFAEEVSFPFNTR